MPDPNPWLFWIIPAAALATVAWYLLPRQAKPKIHTNSREERLARKMAGMVGCSSDQALPAVRREIDIAPNQSDETLVKRAAYHYRQDLPETTCQVYRDSAPT